MQSLSPIVGLGVILCCQGAWAQTPAAPAGPAAPAPVTLTLADALQRARQFSQQIYTASTAALLAHEDTIQAKAALLPTAEGQSGYIYTQPNGTPSGVFVPNDGPHMAVAQRKVKHAQASLDEAREFEDLTQKQERGGEAAKVDVIKAQLQVQQRERDLQDAQATLDKSRMTFAVLLFPNYNQEFGLTDDLDSAPKLPTLADIKTMAAKNSPDIRAAEAAVQQQTFAIGSAHAAYLPTLTVDYFYGLEANQLAIHDREGFNNLGSSVVASLTIPIWNWGATKSKVKQAELQLQLAKNDLSLTQRTLLSEMDTYYVEARVATTQIESLRNSMNLSVENLRLTRLRYTAGESTAQEVVDAQTTLVQARAAFDDGLVRYRLAVANLQTLTGAF